MKKIFPYIIILILLAAVIVLYFKHTPAPVGTQPIVTTQPVSTTTPPKTTPVSTVAVAGMKEYTDTAFGFSFWYPSTWQVSTSKAPFSDGNIKDATVVGVLTVGPIGNDYGEINIKEAHSTTRTVTDTGGAGPIGPITFFFDTNTHTWMTTSAIASGTTNVTTPANISNNSMGGLHLFGGTSRFDTNIIPLSADNFVVINDDGVYNAGVLSKTVVATDPTVATPVSTADQIKTIQAEKDSFAKQAAQ